MLGDIQLIEKKRIQILERAEKKKEEEKFLEGYEKGEKKGYDNGYDNGYYEGKNTGFNIGYSNCILTLLDKYFQNFINGKSVENIDMLGKISLSLLKGRYNNDNNLEKFIKVLKGKNLLTQ